MSGCFPLTAPSFPHTGMKICLLERVGPLVRSLTTLVETGDLMQPGIRKITYSGLPLVMYPPGNGEKVDTSRRPMLSHTINDTRVRAPLPDEMVLIEEQAKQTVKKILALVTIVKLQAKEVQLSLVAWSFSSL